MPPPSDPPPSGSADAPSGKAGRLEKAALADELGPELELVRPLGRGRMASVYLARERTLGRFVAVKVLHGELSADETSVRRFEREARSIAALAHPRIVAVHGFGRLDDGRPYLVLQFVKGRSAEERLVAEGPLPEDEARRVLAAVSAALAAAHREGIVHRDVRPGNVLLEEESGRAYLADFGIAALLPTEHEDVARLTREGERLGDLEYESPEQLLGRDVTEKTDIYSLGILGYRLLTREGPYAASSDRELVVAHVKGRARHLSELRPEVDPELEDLLFRCLAKDPEHRPSAAFLAEAFASPGTAGPAAAELAGVAGLIARVRSRRLFQTVAAYVAGSVAVLGFVGLLVEMAVLGKRLFWLALIACGAGVPASVVLGWYHGEKGAQEVQPLELALLSAIAAGWLVASVLFLVW